MAAPAPADDLHQLSLRAAPLSAPSGASGRHGKVGNPQSQSGTWDTPGSFVPEVRSPVCRRLPAGWSRRQLLTRVPHAPRPSGQASDSQDKPLTRRTSLPPARSFGVWGSGGGGSGAQRSLFLPAGIHGLDLHGEWAGAPTRCCSHRQGSAMLSRESVAEGHYFDKFRKVRIRNIFVFNLCAWGSEMTSLTPFSDGRRETGHPAYRALGKEGVRIHLLSQRL